MMNFKTAALAASIALALGTTAAFAQTPTAPAADTLPGAGQAVAGTASGKLGTGANANTLTVTVGGNAVIDWGKASGANVINPTGTPGFNVGNAATVDFTAGTGNTGSVLNVDVSGNPSQIYGALSADSTITGLFVANQNGIVVGPKGSISSTGAVGLIGNAVQSTSGALLGTFDGSTPTYDTTGGNVTVMPGASISGASVLVSGGGMVNVDVGGITETGKAPLPAVSLQAGQSNGMGTNASTPAADAALTVTGTGASGVAFGLESSGDATIGQPAAGSAPAVAANLTADATSTTVPGTLTVSANGTLAFNGAVSTTYTTKGVFQTGINALVNDGQVNSAFGVGVGSLTNAGALGIGTNAVTTSQSGGLINTGSITAGALDVAGGNLMNSGTASATSVNVTGGNLTNVKGAMFTSTGAVNVDQSAPDANGNTTGGALANGGTFIAGTLNSSTGVFSDGQAVNTEGELANSGTFMAGPVVVSEGSLDNSGSVWAAGTAAVPPPSAGGPATPPGWDIAVIDGHINNAAGATMTLVNGLIGTFSDQNATAGGQYYINNDGTITSNAADGLTVQVNEGGSSNLDSKGNPLATRGSFSNGSTGVLQLGGTAAGLSVSANNNVILGGSIETNTGTSSAPVWTAIGAKNALPGAVTLLANGATPVALPDGSGTGAGVVSVTTPIVSSNASGTAVSLTGGQVSIGADVMATDTTDGQVDILAGDRPAGALGANPTSADYAVNIAAGTTVSGSTGVEIGPNGFAGTVGSPNVLLNGTLSGGAVDFTGSDLLAGPAGSIDSNAVSLSFSGDVKSAQNAASGNFVYNDLQINAVTPPGATATPAVSLTLTPTESTTNGTNMAGANESKVNILVNGSVNLGADGLTAPTPQSGASGTVNQVPNTHLVLQSTGNIATTGAYYWPGTVYLGTINADASGNPLPGTLGSGVISLGGNFSNVLQGDVTGGSGIFFMTQLPLMGAATSGVFGSLFAGTVSTNANAWINFANQGLINAYTNGVLTGTFDGGAVQSAGASGQIKTVQYGSLSDLSNLTNASGVTVLHYTQPNSAN